MPRGSFFAWRLEGLALDQIDGQAQQATVRTAPLRTATLAFRQVAGIVVTDSVLILSATNVFGGGGDSCVYGGPLEGGDGIRATNSQVMAIGSKDNLIQGGYGGSGYECPGPGGKGGAGFRGYSAIVSLVTVKGGKGGPSCPFEPPAERP